MKPDFLAEPPGEVIDTATIRIKRLLPGPIERVWSYLVDSDKRARWLAAGEMEERPGAALDLVFQHSQLSHEQTPERWCAAEGHVHHCRITRCEPPRLLSFSWPEGHGEGAPAWESEVHFELTPQEEGVLLVVTHERLLERDTMVNVAGGWHAHLGLLIDHLSGRPPRGFWSAHSELEKLYGQRIPAG